MRVVVVGASGNLGTALLRRLATEPVVTSLVGVARRVPRADGSSTVRFPHDAASWVRCDLTATPDVVATALDRAFAAADVVVHLAWAIQPSHRRRYLRRVNVDGTRHVTQAAARAGVGHLVVGSSLGAYAPGPAADPDRPVDESWPVTGVPGSAYAQDKAAVEAYLDEVSQGGPPAPFVVSRVRPALVFQRDAASQIARLFLGSVPTTVVRRRALPELPWPEGLRLQCVHADDVAEAYARIVVGRHGGAFNVAYGDLLRGADMAEAIGARLHEVPPTVARSAIAAAWRLRLAPVGEGWLDLTLRVPVLDTATAASRLRWSPSRDARDTLAELVEGIRDRAGASSPPLLPR